MKIVTIPVTGSAGNRGSTMTAGCTAVGTGTNTATNRVRCRNAHQDLVSRS